MHILIAIFYLVTISATLQLIVTGVCVFPVLYRYEKDNKIIYLLPSKITDNPHIIK